MSYSPIESLRVVTIGAGAAGTVLSRALATAGASFQGIVSRSIASAERLAQRVSSTWFSDELADLPDADLFILSVPDGEIGSEASRLAELSRLWERRFVMHLSGARSSELLRPLETVGASTLSFHPMLSLKPDSDPVVFRGARVHLEGGDDAVVFGELIARSIGAEPHRIGPSEKLLLHLSAAVASNFVVSVVSIAAEMLARGGFSPDDFEALLRPLVAGTIANINLADPGSALTGPISRGDVATLGLHLNEVRDRFPEFIPIVANLAAETVRIAVKNEMIEPQQAVEQLALIGEFIESSDSQES